MRLYIRSATSSYDRISIDEFINNVGPPYSVSEFNKCTKARRGRVLKILEEILNNETFEFYDLPDGRKIEDVTITTGAIERRTGTQLMIEFKGHTHLPQVIISNGNMHKEFEYELKRVYSIYISDDDDDWDITSRPDNSYKSLLTILSQIESSDDGIYIERTLKDGTFANGYCKDDTKIPELITQLKASKYDRVRDKNAPISYKDWPISRAQMWRDVAEYMEHGKYGKLTVIDQVKFDSKYSSISEEQFVNGDYDDADKVIISVHGKFYKGYAGWIDMWYRWNKFADKWINTQSAFGHNNDATVYRLSEENENKRRM